MCSLETGYETALLQGVVHNICNRSQEYTDTSSETVQRSGYFQSSVSYINVHIMFK